jgi:outer membrane protein assembly factor BamB
LLKSWPASGPKRVWMYKDAGIGYSGFAIVDGKLYTLGARDGTEMLIALNASKGTELWASKLGNLFTNKWGDGPRGTPTVDGDHVYAMGGQGSLICAKASDGKIVWTTSMKSLDGKRGGWGYTESVLIDGDKVLCTPGGNKGAIAALNKKTGEVIWRSTDFTDGAQYSSIIAIEHDGKRQYVQLTQKTLVGVDAENGNVLWRNAWPGKTAVIPTPIFANGHVYITSGYGVGCKLVKIDGGNATGIYKNTTMVNHHGGVILYQDHLYGYSDRGGWTCQNFMTGEKVWNDRGIGKGAIAYADGMFYLLGERKGDVALIEATTEGYKEKGRFTLSPQTKLRKPAGKVWTHPVILDGRLYLRDQDLIYCYDVKK